MRRKDESKKSVILDFIDEYYNEYNEIPAVRTIAEGTGIALATVHRYLLSLKESGELEYNGRKSISTKRIDLESRHASAPVLGYVRCGEGEEETEEVIEYIRLPESLVGTGEFFVLIAKGDSMIDAGVNEGDYVVIRKQNTASDGDYVVALYEGLNNLKELVVDNGFRVKAQTNVHRKNIESMLPTARLLDEMGVYEMRIIRTTEVPRWNENAKGATLDLDEYFAGMLDFVREYISEDHKMVIDIWQLMTLFPRSKSYHLRIVACCDGEYKPTRPVCPGNRSMVAVSANGNVFPCMQMSGYYEARNDILGNVKEYGLRPLLQMGKYLAEVCATVGELSEKNEECRNCPYFKYCAAGCRAVALTLTGDKMGVDLSKCLFFKKGYYEKVVRTMGDFRNNTPINV